MTGLIVFGCILLFFVLILSVKATVTVEYSDDIRLTVKVLCFKIKILPKKPKKKKGPQSMSKKQAEKIRKGLRKKAAKKRQKQLEKQKKKQQKKEQKELEKKQPQKEPKKKLSLSDILALIKMAGDIVSTLFKTFFGHLRINVARLHVNLAMGDAATTAIAYGAVSNAAMYLFEILDKVKGIDLPDVKDVSINADFLGESTTVNMKISVSLRPWHLFHVLFAVIGKAIKHLFKIFVIKGK